MATPLVSVVMPTYNHEPFVREAIESVLAQRGVEFELLVEDDASTDGTARVVEQIRDPRVRFWSKDRNQGASTTVNNLLARAQGEFVALINSDDTWAIADKLAMQVEVLRSGPALGACFGRAVFVGATGATYTREQLYSPDIFAQGNRSRGAWLRQFFLGGNCLCHPSVLVRRSIYQELGGYDNRLRQIPDFDLWIRMVKRYGIHVCDEELVRFRVVAGANASAPTPANTIRLMNEHYLLLAGFFDGVSRDLLLEGFGELLLNPGPRSEAEFEVEKALLFFKGEQVLRNVYRMIGLRKVHALLGQPEHRRVLADYAIDDAWLQREMGEYSPFVSVLAPPAAPAAAEPRPPRPLLRYLSFLRR